MKTYVVYVAGLCDAETMFSVRYELRTKNQVTI
jgi:hypothetical protein